MKDRTDVDVVVIGSGFGGSVCAARLAEAGLAVCLLERSKRYRTGDFPRTPGEMGRAFWDPSEGRYGMFNDWTFKGIRAVVASGLGVGSLIYANVLIRMPRAWFGSFAGLTSRPITYADLEPRDRAVEARIGVQPYPFADEPYRNTPKTAALKEAADQLGLHWERPTSPSPLPATVRRPYRASRSSNGGPTSTAARESHVGFAASATSAATTAPRIRSTTRISAKPR